MEGALLEATTVAWSSLSALAVLVLGALGLLAWRSRAPGSFAFAAFAVVWSLHVLVGQWMGYATEPATAARLNLLYLALLLPLPYLLAQFARTFASGGRGLPWRAATGATVLLPLAVVLALVLEPALVYRGPMEIYGHLIPRWGPLFAPLVILPFFATMCGALATLDGARRRATTARAAERAGILAAGLGLFTSFAVANNLAFYAADIAFLGALPLASAYTAIFLALTLWAAYVGARAASDAAAAPSAKLRRAPTLVALATLVPLAWGLVEGLVAYLLLPRFNTIGLWRLAGVAVIAYGIARARAPELAPRSRHTVATAFGVAVAAAAGAVAIGALMLMAPGAPFLLLAATTIPLAALAPSVRLARRVLRVPRAPDRSEATLPARIETYRAALESALARGSLGDDAPFLAALREELGISDDVHEALLVISRESVLPPPDETHPGYERLRLLGEGAHGRAWLARRRADDELVVLKEPRVGDERARQGLAREARHLLQLRHPRLVRIHEVVAAPSGTFLVMDHMSGGSLTDVLARGPLSPRDAAHATAEVLEGLEALHRAGLAHGDVKPGNVLLDATGAARLADFALTRPYAVDATRTLAGEGSLASMAPELLDGRAPDPSTDLYAAGALLYRLLAGEHYLRLEGLDDARARDAIRTQGPRLPHPRVPPALEPILRRALAKDRAARYASAREMRDALLAAASEL
ncbi:MAG TPA: serine/threonine-protein kinase [Candidatus Thermoplasmatota archaeon]|nr:serine/threonine-protein kinase [Candidatus Thermoplasmatota archaeon]